MSIPSGAGEKQSAPKFHRETRSAGPLFEQKMRGGNQMQWIVYSAVGRCLLLRASGKDVLDGIRERRVSVVRGQLARRAGRRERARCDERGRAALECLAPLILPNAAHAALHGGLDPLLVCAGLLRVVRADGFDRVVENVGNCDTRRVERDEVRGLVLGHETERRQCGWLAGSVGSLGLHGDPGCTRVDSLGDLICTRRIDGHVLVLVWEQLE